MINDADNQPPDRGRWSDLLIRPWLPFLFFGAGAHAALLALLQMRPPIDAAFAITIGGKFGFFFLVTTAVLWLQRGWRQAGPEAKASRVPFRFVGAAVVASLLALHAEPALRFGDGAVSVKHYLLRSNETLPRVVSAGLIQEPLAADERTVIYRYTFETLASTNVEPTRFQNLIRSELAATLCADPETASLLERGFSLRYVYRGADDASLADARFAPDHCSRPG